LQSIDALHTHEPNRSLHLVDKIKQEDLQLRVDVSTARNQLVQPLQGTRQRGQLVVLKFPPAAPKCVGRVLQTHQSRVVVLALDPVGIGPAICEALHGRFNLRLPAQEQLEVVVGG
jgi:hypothetical protein